MVKIWKTKYINGSYVKDNKNVVSINVIVVLLMSSKVDKIKLFESIWKESDESHFLKIWC